MNLFWKKVLKCCLRKKKNLSELNSEIIFRISIDEKSKKDKNYVNYIICAYEKNDMDYSPEKYNILFAISNGSENYDVLQHYFKTLHKEIQYYINKKLLI